MLSSVGECEAQGGKKLVPPLTSCTLQDTIQGKEEYLSFVVEVRLRVLADCHFLMLIGCTSIFSTISMKGNSVAVIQA